MFAISLCFSEHSRSLLHINRAKLELFKIDDAVLDFLDEIKNEHPSTKQRSFLDSGLAKDSHLVLQKTS